jgi:hypothetical protein
MVAWAPGKSPAFRTRTDGSACFTYLKTKINILNLTYLSTFLLTCVHICLCTYLLHLPTHRLPYCTFSTYFLPAGPPILYVCISICLAIYKPATYLCIRITSCLPACLATGLPSFLPTCLSVFLSTNLTAYLSVHSPVCFHTIFRPDCQVYHTACRTDPKNPILSGIS